MHGQIGAKAARRRSGLLRRLAARTGNPQAVTATARKLAVLVYHVLRGDFVYRDPGADGYDAQQRARQLRQLRQRTTALPSSATKPVSYSAVSFLGVAKGISIEPATGRNPRLAYIVDPVPAIYEVGSSLAPIAHDALLNRSATKGAVAPLQGVGVQTCGMP